LLRCLIEEVQLRTEEGHYHIRIVWKGGATTEREVLRGKGGWAQRTPEGTVALVRKLAREFDDAQIARILKQARSALGPWQSVYPAKRHLTPRQASHLEVREENRAGHARRPVHRR
jgi:hypothetical protein